MMNAIQNKKQISYNRVLMFFNKEGDALAAQYPAIGLARTELVRGFKAMDRRIQDIIDLKNL